MHSTPHMLTGRDVAISSRKMLLHAVWLSAVLTVIPLLPFRLIWGADRLTAGIFNPVVIPAAFVLVVVHEMIHAISWKIAGRLKWSDISFGIMWKTLSPYCHAKAPMTASAYRVGTAMPGLLIGLLPVIIATLTGDGTLTFVSAIMIGGAAGDMYVLWIIRAVKGNSRVIDHPSKVGCILLPD